MTKNSFAPECEEYGKEIDRLTIEKDYSGLETYIGEVESFSKMHEEPPFAPIFYYIGTGKGILADNYRRIQGDENALISKQYRKQSLYYMRKALGLLEDFGEDKTLLLMIYTNYANQLDSCGRVIEALRIYRKAINISPYFAMAVGNYGRALQFYANLVNDSGHYKYLHCYAYQAIRRALNMKDINMHQQAIECFNKIIEEYESLQPKEHLSEPIVFDDFDLGTHEEKAYRMWCLYNHLFLNPLNDLIEQEPAFAHDPLTITEYTEYVDTSNPNSNKDNNPPKWFCMLNQLKEEYTYARFLCYEGTEKVRELHYADKNVKLSLASYDYVNYSIRLEQLKSAFRTLFSMFDKIAFIINAFWDLGFNERQADASHVFSSENYPQNNFALTALYWSYCEFSEKFGKADSPFERDLKILRNALEHKFVKIHEYSYDTKLQIEEDGFYHISEEEMGKQTLRLLELVREWIMELVYAIGIEESKKSSNELVINLKISDFDDEWKI